MKKVILLLVVFFCSAMFTSSFAQEKESKVVESKAVTIDASRGTDPNIITPKPTNDIPAPKPTDESTRGSLCKVIIDNYTGYAIDIYVDGNYKGSIAAYGSGYTYAIKGQTKLYGKSIGGTKVWGPTYVDCNYVFTWNLLN